MADRMDEGALAPNGGAAGGGNLAHDAPERAVGHAAAEHDAHDRNDARLVRMANQIATFFASQPAVEPGRAVAAHLNDFWPPQMRLRLLEMIAAGGTDLRPEAAAAAPLIRRPGDAPKAVAGVDPGTPPTREAVEGAPTEAAFAAEPEGSDG